MIIPDHSQLPIIGMDTTEILRALPGDMALAVERVDANDLALRAAAVGIVAYADELHPRRHGDYVAGRLAARSALQQSGAHALVVGRDGDAPIWPKGYCGSISHSAGLAVAIAAASPPWRALGIDIEARIGANRLRALRFALTADELRACELDDDPWTKTRAWAAKEAAFKCCAALGANPTMQDLAPEWMDAHSGSVSVSVDHASVRIELVSRVTDELMWVIASVRDGAAIKC